MVDTAHPAGVVGVDLDGQMLAASRKRQSIGTGTRTVDRTPRRCRCAVPWAGVGRQVPTRPLWGVPGRPAPNGGEAATASKSGTATGPVNCMAYRIDSIDGSDR